MAYHLKKVILTLLMLHITLASFFYSPLSNRFDLRFEYACREGVAFKSCLADVVWNGQIIVSIVPSDYNIRTFTAQVQAKVGLNRLQIEGAGDSDSFGLTVDSFRLVRVGSNQNIIVNGGFEHPSVGHGWKIFNDIPGWKGDKIEIGWGKIYNSRWNSQVTELDSNGNSMISQSFSFDQNFQLLNTGSCTPQVIMPQTLTYKLEFDYAARSTQVRSPQTSQANVIWNDMVVAKLKPEDFQVHQASFNVQLKAGHNVLSFDAVSHSDSFGLTIDNVRLTSAFDSNNLIVNGGFEDPQVGRGKWRVFQGGIQGWKAAKAEVGDCKALYNGNWSASTGQCIELDSDSNQRYSQTIDISPQQFAALAARQGH